MAFSNIDNLQLGKFLQIAFSEGVRSQLSQDFKDWEFVKQQRVSDPQGREIRFLFQRSWGMGAVQARNPNGSNKFPDAQQSSTTEHSAVYKEFDVTIELEYNLLKRLEKSKDVRYADALANEIQSKAIASKRFLAAMFYRDGTGVIATVLTAVDTTGAGGSVLITLNTSNSSRGHIGFCELGDLLFNRNSDGSADNPTVVGTFYAWRVKSRSRKLDQVTLEAIDSSGSVLSLTASSIDAGDFLYRFGQPTFPDLTAPVSDYGTVSEEWAGLETLSANDGRVVHGITMSGASAGTVNDAGGNPIDVSQIHELMDSVKINVGQSAYNYRMMMMAPESLASLIESRETDRRFNTVEDGSRGTKKFIYQHLDSSLEAGTSEYCPKKRLYILPDSKSGNKVLEYHGTDFEPVRVGSSEMFLRPDADGGHQRRISSYMMALGSLICKHPAAIGRLENFTS